MNNPVPEGWEKCQFGDAADIAKGLTYSTSNYSTKELGHPFITLKCIKKSGGFSEVGLKYYLGDFKPHHVVNDGDVVFANTDLTRDGDVVGSPLQVPKLPSDKPSLISMDLSRVVPKHNTVKGFIYYWLKTPEVKRHMINFSAGSTVLHLHTKSVPSIPMVLPPLPEQQKIATILTSVDNVIESTQDQINKLQDLKTGMMQELLTQGIGHSEFKDSPVGRIPVGWDVKPLGELAEQVKPGPFGSSLTKAMYVESGYKVYGQEQVISGDLKVGDYYIDQEKYEALKVFKVNAGEILISLVGTFGQVVVVPDGFEPGIINPRLLKLRFSKNKINPNFVAHQLRSEFVTSQLNKLQQGGTMGVLSATTMKPVNLIVPPLPEQNKIEATITALDSRVCGYTQKLEQAKLLKKALMQDLLTGKVRVKTD